MALKPAGVRLVAEGYNQYMTQMRNINRAHKETFQQGAKDVKKMGPAAKEASQGVTQLGGAMQGLGSIMKASVIGVIAIIVAKLAGMVMKFKEFMRISGQVAMRNETLAVSLNTIGTEYGYSQKQIDWAVESLRQQGITATAARQSLMRMARANISWAEASKLAAIAQGSAVAAGMDSSAAFDRLVTGIQKREPELLDELGITLRRGEAYKKLGNQLGKNSKELTNAEQQQAILNSIYEQSEKVLKVYDNAMTTAGKRQGSLTRHIEDTQLNLGQLLLPLQNASITMETSFWKGAKKATQGLATFGIVIQQMTEDLGLLGKGAEETEKFFERIGTAVGRAIHNTAQRFMMFQAWLGGFLTATSAAMGEWLIGMAKGFDLVVKLQFEAAGEAFAAAQTARKEAYDTTFIENMTAKAKEYVERFPDLFKSYDELRATAEEDLNLVTDATEETTAATEEQIKALQRQIQLVKQAESIQERFGKGMIKAREEYGRTLAELDQKLIDDRAALEAKSIAELAKLEATGIKERAQILADGAKETAQAEKEFNRDQAQARRRFQMDQFQSERRFKLEEERLRASGDILGLKRLREDYELQKQEAKEGFDEQQRTAREAYQAQQQAQEEAMQQRLKELDVSLAERRQEVMNSYDEELDQLIKAHAEQQAAAKTAYDERLASLVKAREEELYELGRSLALQGEMTQDSVDEIGGILGELFGDDGLGAQLVRGFSEAALDSFGEAIQGMIDDLASLQEGMEQAESGEAVTASTGSRGRGLTRPSGRSRRGRRTGMRAGGVGVVEGPAAFEVEPGVREAFAFVPLPRTRSTMNVQVAGGIDLRGADNASPGTVDRAVDEMVLALKVAAERLAKGG
jgi:biotin operon repressor